MPSSAAPEQLTEICESTGAKVDRDAGVIRNVKLLGYKSQHGYEYTAEAARQAIPLYEGQRANLGHSKNPADERPFKDQIGRVVNVRESSDGLYGDLELIKSHPMAPALMESAERMPNLVGLSHAAHGRRVTRNGKQLVEQINKVFSIDVTTTPATTRGLFESMQGGPPAPQAAPNGQQPPPPNQQQQQKGSAIAQAFVAEAIAILQDGRPEDEQMADIENLLTAKKEAMAKINGASDQPDEGAPAESSEKSGDDKPNSEPPPEKKKERTMSESTTTTAAEPTVEELQEQLRQLQVRDEVRDLFESVGVKPTDVVVRAACLLESADERKEFVESLKDAAPPAPPANRPRSSGPLLESTRPATGYESKGAEGFAALLR